MYLYWSVRFVRKRAMKNEMKQSAVDWCNPRSLINQFVTLTDDQEFCMGITLLCIDPPCIDLSNI